MSGILLVEIVGPYTALGEAFGRHLTDTMVGVVLAQTFVASPFLVVSARSAFAIAATGAVLPMPLAALTEGSPARGEEVVLYDDLGAGPGSLIGLSEGREAANPFGKTKTPVDAYCACLIDQLSV